MQRTLSVRHTGLLKFVLPLVWIGVVGFAAWRLWFSPEDVVLDHDEGLATAATRWILVAAIAVSLLVLVAFVVPLKRVRLAPDGLLVSNYVREIAVPFGAIARVRQDWLPTFRLITLDLRTETPLGRRVIFMPAGRPRMAFWREDYWREDDVVGELRRLAGLTEPSTPTAAR